MKDLAGTNIAVIGSTMMDLTVYADILPAAGETRFGDSFTTGFGGKGANQAVMAALGPDRDATIEEVRASLAEQGLIFGFGTIQRFFARHAITRKKRPRTPPNRTAPTS